MANKLETRFLEELHKRQRQKRKKNLLSILRLVGMALLGLGLVYIAYAAQSGVVLLLLILGIAIATLLLRRDRNPLKFFKKTWRYCLGFGLLAMALTYQANPSLLNAPIGNLYVRLAHSPAPSAQTTGWPWATAQTPHPAIAALPASAETSINSVARYISETESDPQQQVKAIHDYVIQRLQYDLEVLTTGERPPQDAANVFTARKAVCEGYAKLFQALAQAAGLEVAYVTGDVRRDLAPVDVIPKLHRAASPQYDWTRHAWNAVKVNDSWHLVDTTWDDSDVTYDASYLMPPATAMITSHLPSLSAWQLLDQKKTKRTFEQLPLLTPDFFAEGLELVSPTTYVTETQNSANITVKQPPNYQHRVVAYAIQEKTASLSIWDLSKEDSTKQICNSQPIGSGNTTITCNLEESGNYQVFLFGLDEAQQNVVRLGQLKFQAA